MSSETTVIQFDSVEALKSISEFARRYEGTCQKGFLLNNIIAHFFVRCAEHDYSEDVKAFLNGFKLRLGLQPKFNDARFTAIPLARRIFFWYMRFPSLRSVIVEACGFAFDIPGEGKTTLFDCYVQGKAAVINDEQLLPHMRSATGWEGGRAILFLSSYIEPKNGSTFKLENANLYLHLTDPLNGLAEGFQRSLSRIGRDWKAHSQAVPVPAKRSWQIKKLIKRKRDPDSALVPHEIRLSSLGRRTPLKRSLLRLKMGRKKHFTCSLYDVNGQRIPYGNYLVEWECFGYWSQTLAVGQARPSNQRQFATLKFPEFNGTEAVQVQLRLYAHESQTLLLQRMFSLVVSPRDSEVGKVRQPRQRRSKPPAGRNRSILDFFKSAKTA
jgi:hypothetical protein